MLQFCYTFHSICSALNKYSHFLNRSKEKPIERSYLMHTLHILRVEPQKIVRRKTHIETDSGTMAN